MAREFLPLGSAKSEPLTFSHTGALEPYLPQMRNSNEPKAIYPHVTLTYAQSLDGQISLNPGTQTILSGPETKAMTHYLRSRHAGILVGAGTARADNPGLNTRYSEDGVGVVGMERQPRPFVLDPSGGVRVEQVSRLFALAERGLGKPPCWIVSGRSAAAGVAVDVDLNAHMGNRVQGLGGKVLDAGAYEADSDSESEKGLDWGFVLREMMRDGVESVMIEGGGRVIRDLLRRNNQKYISSVIVTIAPTYLGAGGVDVAPRRTMNTNEVTLRDVKWMPLGQDAVMAAFIY